MVGGEEGILCRITYEGRGHGHAGRLKVRVLHKLWGRMVSYAAYFLILETIQPKLWGSQSWLQPAFSRPLSREGSLTSRKSRLKSGCGQDCPPHDKCRTSPTEKVCGIRMVSCAASRKRDSAQSPKGAR